MTSLGSFAPWDRVPAALVLGDSFLTGSRVLGIATGDWDVVALKCPDLDEAFFARHGFQTTSKYPDSPSGTVVYQKDDVDIILCDPHQYGLWRAATQTMKLLDILKPGSMHCRDNRVALFAHILYGRPLDNLLKELV